MLKFDARFRKLALWGGIGIALIVVLSLIAPALSSGSSAGLDDAAGSGDGTSGDATGSSGSGGGLLGGLFGGGEPEWTVTVNASDAASTERVEQSFTWNPVTNRITGVESSTGRARGIDEVREAGWSTRPTGYFLLNEAILGYENGGVRQLFTFRFDGEYDTVLDGSVTVRTRVNGAPRNLVTGDFIVTTGIDDPEAVREFLRERSPSYLYESARQRRRTGELTAARDLLDDALQIDPSHVAANELQADLRHAAGDFQGAWEAEQHAWEAKQDQDRLVTPRDHYRLGHAAMLTGDLQGAGEHFAEARSLWADYRRAYEEQFGEQWIYDTQALGAVLHVLYSHAVEDNEQREEYFAQLPFMELAAGRERYDDVLMLDLAGKPRATLPVAALAAYLPALIRSDVPELAFAEAWRDSLLTQLAELDEQMVSIVGGLAEYDADSDTYAAVISDGDGDDLERVLGRIETSGPDIPAPFSNMMLHDVLAYHLGAYKVLVALGEIEQAYEFGLYEYFPYDYNEVIYQTIAGEPERAGELIREWQREAADPSYHPAWLVDWLNDWVSAPVYVDAAAPMNRVLAFAQSQT